MQRHFRAKTFILFNSVLLCLGWNCCAEPLSVDEEDDPRHGKPLWEFGLFNGAVRLPQYRGSDEDAVYVVPIPYMVYRGKVLRSGRDGIKGIFFRGDRLQTDISLSGNPPVSRDNEARSGMPVAGALMEIGPALKYALFDRATPNSLFLRGAVRAAFSFDVYDDLRSAGEGFRVTVDMVGYNRTLFEGGDLSFGGSLSIDFFDDEYSDFFYGVSSEHVLSSRPFYAAQGGYAGSAVSVHATRQLSKHWGVGAFGKWINLDGAAFEDSPLVKTKNNFVVGCALIWRIAESKKLAP